MDQNRLPFAFAVVTCRTVEEVAEAIRTMTVRGAPSIGPAAGFGLALAFRAGREPSAARKLLASTRPTARDLFHALERVDSLDAAQSFADATVAACRAIGEAGRPLIRDGMTVMTHCNAGWLAAVDIGTATAPLYLAHAAGVRFRVLVSRTSPRDQGARLTAWELAQEGIDHRIIEDSAAGRFIQRGEVGLVLVGADRIAANGDVANKVGTYLKALAASRHGVPFVVAAPESTIDCGCPDGASIPIEERPSEEVLYRTGPDDEGKMRRILTASPGSQALNPAFDVTPRELVTEILTERGPRRNL